jgi:hypothetical protein
MMLRSRPATMTDVQRFYPGLGVSVRAWVCEIDGEVQGIIGIAITRPAHSIFSMFSEALRPHLRSLTVLRLVKWLADLLPSFRAPIFAIREPGGRQAPHILKRLGFRFYGIVDGDAVYRFEGGR